MKMGVRMNLKGATIRRRDYRRWYAALLLFVMILTFSFLVQKFKGDDEVDAASLAGFDPGYIISDYQMGNYNSMNEAQIQAFLTSKNSCGNRDYGYYVALSGNPNYRWHFENGHFICLSEERFGYNDNEIGFQYGETAAHIIWQASQDYRINPQVLLVLLQKETGLITDPIPNNGDYRKATGFGCPDTAACSSKYYGFRNQIRNAASLFRTVLDGGWTNYPLGNNYIQYNPNAACGGSVVNVRSLATSALYRYTPYQPNAGALAAGYGTASCGAYGNRNFYLYFEDWFGGITRTNVEWEAMKEKRVMTVGRDTLVVDAGTNKTLPEWVRNGNNYFFVRKTTVYWDNEQQTCLQRDVDVGTNKCILMKRLSDLDISKIERFESRKYRVIDYTCAVDLRHKEAACDTVEYQKGRELMANGIILIGGETYLVNDDSGYGVLQKRLREKYNYEDIGEKLMRLLRTDYKYLARTNNKVQTLTVATNQYIKVSEKVKIDGRVYYRTVHDKNKGLDYVIPESALSEEVLIDFLYPRNMTIKSNSNLIDLATGEICQSYRVGDTKKYVKKVEYRGKMYYQSEDKLGTYCVVPASDLDDAAYNFNNSGALGGFVNFLYPRRMKALRDAYLVDLRTGITCDEYLKKGDVQRYTTKAVVDGFVFYRSEINTSKNSVCAVSADIMGEF